MSQVKYKPGDALEVTKHFQGGSTKIKVKLTKRVLDCYGQKDSLMEYLAGLTEGGRCYGYSLSVKRLRKARPKKEAV